MAPLCLAVDIGGTKVAVGLVDRTGTVLYKEDHVPTPHTRDPDEVWSALCGLITSVAAQAPEESLVVCGVGCGGPMTPGGATVSPLNIPAWRGFPLRSALSAHLGLPVAIDNDAKALALGEGWIGAARDSHNFIAMVVSTGVGGGIVLDGRLLDGRLGNAGHIGHTVVEPDGRPCACGGVGCLEAEASGTAITAITGRDPAEASPAMIERTGTLVGRAVASTANLLDLDLAVVAGSVALGFGEPFFAAARVELAKRARMDFSRSARIEPGGLGAHGPIVGAGAVGWRTRSGARWVASREAGGKRQGTGGVRLRPGGGPAPSALARSAVHGQAARPPPMVASPPVPPRARPRPTGTSGCTPPSARTGQAVRRPTTS